MQQYLKSQAIPQLLNPLGVCMFACFYDSDLNIEKAGKIPLPNGCRITVVTKEEDRTQKYQPCQEKGSLNNYDEVLGSTQWIVGDWSPFIIKAGLQGEGVH